MPTEQQRRKHDRDLAVKATQEFLLNCFQSQVELYVRLTREAITAGNVNLANAQGVEPIERLAANYKRLFALIG